MRCNHGFTLIELLIAISILAIVAVLGWRGLDSIVRSRDALTAELEQTRALQLTFAQLQSDCSQNINPLSFTNLPEGRSIWVEPQRLILIRNEFADNEAPSMRMVVYRLQNSNLTRFESIPTRDLAVLKQLLIQARNPPEDQVEIVMQKNIQDIEFSGYPESSLTSDAANTLTTPPVTPPANPPTANPPPANPPANPPPAVLPNNNANVTTGLQVSLQLQNHDKKILKIFMLGGA